VRVPHPEGGGGGVSVVMYDAYTKREKSKGKIRKGYTEGCVYLLISVINKIITVL